MKLLKKINKGVALTVVVLTILVIYIISLEVQRNKEKGEIQEVCKQYLEFENQYTLLPKESRSFKIKDDKDYAKKMEKYKEEWSSKLKELMIENKEIYKQQEDIIEDKLLNQVEGNIIYTSKNSKLVKISKYEFEDEQVTVTIDDSMEREFMKLIDEKEKTTNTENKTDKIQDTIVLKKENGKWKVVFAEVGMTDEIYSNYSQTDNIF